jgi:hypothetical protein
MQSSYPVMRTSDPLIEPNGPAAWIPSVFEPTAVVESTSTLVYCCVPMLVVNTANVGAFLILTLVSSKYSRFAARIPAHQAVTQCKSPVLLPARLPFTVMSRIMSEPTWAGGVPTAILIPQVSPPAVRPGKSVQIGVALLPFAITKLLTFIPSPSR